jgi:hypothetical protein
MFDLHDGERPANVLRRGWERVARRKAIALERVAALRHSVLNRRYEVSLFTFKEKPLEPKLRRRLGARRPGPRAPSLPSRIFVLSPGQISRRAHGGLLLKVLAAWREHAR